MSNKVGENMSSDIVVCSLCKAKVVLPEGQESAICGYCGRLVTITGSKRHRSEKIIAFNRGNEYLIQGNFDKALDEFEKVVHLDETDAEAHWCCMLSRFGVEFIDDPIEHDFLPTCHKTSTESVFSDFDYKAAIEYAGPIKKRQYMALGAKIAHVLKDILTIAENAEPYDIFICYKHTDANGNRTTDSEDAESLYKGLTEQGYRVFFAAESLKGKSDRYEPYIYGALTSSPVMLVVGSKPEHFEAAWVKNEWSRFLSMKRSNPDKVIIPCYRNMKPESMPDELYPFQSYDISEISFMTTVLSILQEKFKNKDTSKTEINSQTSATLTSLTKRMWMFLEDGDISKSKEYANRILDIEPENWKPYSVLLLLDCGVKSKEGLVTSDFSMAESRFYHHLISFAPDEVCNEYKTLRRAQELFREKKAGTTQLSKLEEEEKDILTKIKNLSSEVREAESNFSATSRANKIYKNRMKRAITTSFITVLGVFVGALPIHNVITALISGVCGILAFCSIMCIFFLLSFSSQNDDANLNHIEKKWRELAQELTNEKTKLQKIQEKKRSLQAKQNEIEKKQAQLHIGQKVFKQEILDSISSSSTSQNKCGFNTKAVCCMICGYQVKITSDLSNYICPICKAPLNKYGSYL